MFCKKCGKQIPDDAGFCTYCGEPTSVSDPQLAAAHKGPDIPAPVKKKKKRKAWKIVLGTFLALLGISMFGNAVGGGQKPTPPAEIITEESTEVPIVYTAVTVDDLIELLQENALKAQKKYQGQYVEVTGRMDVIDSSGKYIGLYPQYTDFSLTSVMCLIKTAEQENQVLELNKGDIVTVKGKIRDVGEVMGYALDIDEIVK